MMGEYARTGMPKPMHAHIFVTFRLCTLRICAVSLMNDKLMSNQMNSLFSIYMKRIRALSSR